MSAELKLGTVLPGQESRQAGNATGILCQAGLFPCIATIGIGMIMEMAELAARGQDEIQRMEIAAYRASSALTELPVHQRLRDSFIRTAREQAGQEIKTFSDRTLADSDMLIEIDGYAIELLHLYPSSPTFRMVTRIRLVQRATGQELYREDFEYFGQSAKLAIWGANDAQHLREEFERACQDLAERITDTLFLLYRFPTTPSLHNPAIKSGVSHTAVTYERKG